jgi:hypothetical protein
LPVEGDQLCSAKQFSLVGNNAIREITPHFKDRQTGFDGWAVHDYIGAVHESMNGL